MVKTRQGWVLLLPLELLAVEVVGGVTLVGNSWMLAVAAAAVSAGASLMSVVLASETEAAVSMVFAVPEVAYPAADVMSSMGALTMASGGGHIVGKVLGRVGDLGVGGGLCWVAGT
eukprot:g21131.t1